MKEGVAAAEEKVSCGQLRKQLENALSRYGELMAHVKKAAEEDAARRAEGEHLEEASKEHRLPCERSGRKMEFISARVLGMDEGKGIGDEDW